MSASWLGITPGDFSTCSFTALLTKRNESIFGTTIAGLDHTSCRFRNTSPNANRAATHDANHLVFTGSYRLGLAFTADAPGFSWTPVSYTHLTLPTILLV